MRLRGWGERSVPEQIRIFLCICTLAFYIGALCAPDLPEMFSGLIRIVTGPARLTKDYFAPQIGGVSAALLNQALMGTLYCGLMFLPNGAVNGITVAAYFLNLGFGTFGMNVFNGLAFLPGIWLYCRLKGEPFGQQINTAMFSMALSPLVSEALFRYPGTVTHPPTIQGVALALLIGLGVGLVMPALCKHARTLHKGYDLYNAAPAAGFLCCLLYATMYRAVGVEPAEVSSVFSEGFPIFVNVFCAVFFSLCLLTAFVLNGFSLRGYGQLIHNSGYRVDFTEKYGFALTLMNAGVFGLCILTCYNIVGARFTGPTYGVIWCMLSFSAAGSTPLNVFPVVLGYTIASNFGVYEIDVQGILVGLCFASGLSPIAGVYGPVAGMVAGAMHYFLVTSVPLIHGGFNLYNGGFSAALVCLVLVPVLECYSGIGEERLEKRAQEIQENAIKEAAPRE